MARLAIPGSLKIRALGKTAPQLSHSVGLLFENKKGGLKTLSRRDIIVP
jgi:hypothetical protein